MSRQSKRFCYILLGVCSVVALCSCSSYKFPLETSYFPKWFSSSSAPAKEAPASGEVVVAKGDTLYSIARTYGVPLRSLIEVNNLRQPYTLAVGQTLRLPSSAHHVVQKGDTIYSVSRKYGVDMRALARANGLNYPYAIYVGQKLSLPARVAGAKGGDGDSMARGKVASASAPKKVVKAQGKIATPPKRSSNQFAWPHKGKVVLPFGDLGGGRHNDGINIKAKKGDAVVAADNGVIAYAGNELKGFGNLVLIKHSDGWMTAYAHLDKIVVKKNQKVNRGQKIGEAGNTGNISSPEVHFEVRKGAKAKDPLLYLEKK